MMNQDAFGYQEQAARLLRDERRNLLVVAPTGAGKTEVGFTGLEVYTRGVYVAPSRALCHEKAEWLRERFPKAAVVLGNKDYSLSLGSFRGSDIRVVTPWKLGVVLHNDPNFAKNCPLVIVDEIHDLEPEVELILTKLKELNSQVRIVGLSATVDEEDEPRLASWLNAAVVKSDERPVPLLPRVAFFDLELNDEGEEETLLTITEGAREMGCEQLVGNPDEVGRVMAIAEHIREHVDTAPMLVYTPYRERARRIAEEFADHALEYDDELEAEAATLPDDAGDFTETLKRCLPCGIGIHHGGCTAQERELVYTLAREGKLSVVVTCQTLAQGVNLPARHVIVESVYQEPGRGEKRRLMDISKFWQVAGRAGRPQFDSIGYVWIACSSEIELAEIEEVLLKHKASKIESRVYEEYFLTAHVAGLVALGYTSPKKLSGFMKATYFGTVYQDEQALIAQFERVIARLIQEGFATTVGSMLILTERGMRLARLSLHPGEYQVLERLIAAESVEYATWVREIVAVCGEHALGRVPAHEEVEEVVALGLTAYSVKASHAIREIVDYVSRVLELARILMRLNGVGDAFQERWQREVANRFLFGEIEFARELAKVLPTPAVKRVLRNFGPAIHGRDLKSGEERPLDDAGIKTLAQIIWGFSGLPRDASVLAKVAGVFRVTETRFRRLAEEALAAKKAA